MSGRLSRATAVVFKWTSERQNAPNFKRPAHLRWRQQPHVFNVGQHRRKSVDFGGLVM